MNAKFKTAVKVLVPLTIAGVIGWVVAGLEDFDPNDQPVGYVGMPAVSSHLLYLGNDDALRTRLYAIDYDAYDWSGNLHSYPLSAAGAVVKTDDWTGGAAARIDVQNCCDTTKAGHRKIVTRDGSTNIAFQWSGTSALSATQRMALDPDSETAKKAVARSPVVDYLRGDRDNEDPKGKKYRARSTVLGDMIHSTPVYCPATAPSAAPQCTAATVFVGANDGMLHAINAADGSERFAYIPSMLIPRLAALTESDFEHQYFVDGRMAIRRFGSTTILAGALGAGGQGLYALDVSNAAAASEADAAAKILWEISNATTGFANLGYTYGQPVLATLPSGTNALIVGNGYNNSGNGRASLFIINAATGALIQEIITPDAGSLASRNGLSSPTLIDTNTDGKADYAYAGDLDGNLWKFNLSANTVAKLHTVDPVQSITMAPGIVGHPSGNGFIVTFVTGRMLVDADRSDNATHYAYGVWDAAPNGATTLLAQTLTEVEYTGATPSIRVRWATDNAPDWTTHKGWRTALPVGGERMVGDGAFVTGAVFMFLSTNPVVEGTPPAPSGENWWMQINAVTGGDSGSVRFDLNDDGTFSNADTVTVSGNAKSPVGRNMGGGVRSQLTAIRAGAFDVYQANYDKNSGTVPDAGGPGVSGGHFDFDLYYYTGSPITTYTPTGTGQTGNSPFCAKTNDVNDELGELSPSWCVPQKGYGPTYDFLTAVATGAACGGKKAKTNLQTITCNEYVTHEALSGYTTIKHVHEYDDKYDVTGVNMLAASDSSFNLPNAIPSTTQQFKVLVMNQYLNPAAKLAIGPSASEVNVKTYGDLASQTDPAALLTALPTYTRGNVGTMIYNLPLNAFKSKDWWGDGGTARAGLIPTQTGCVNNVTATGGSSPLGSQGERHNGALTIQLIRADTPASALEFNVNGDVRYGWRVRAQDFTAYVLAEYTSFWHHPNGECYGDAGWVPNPPEDFTSNAKAAKAAAGSADPKGVFGSGGSPPPTVVTNKDGSTTTTYADGTVIIQYPDGRVKTTLPDGTVIWFVPGVDTGGVVDTTGTVDLGGVTTPPETAGRIDWRELRR